MKKVILTAVVATFLMSSCHKESNYNKCEGSKYLKDGTHYLVYTSKGKCFYNKSFTGNNYKQIPSEYCPCLD